MKRWSLLGTVAVASLLAGAPARAAGDKCPDERATTVPGFPVGSGEGAGCALQVTLFGVGGVVLDEHCPKVRLNIPERGVCIGETQENALCGLAGLETVTIQTCHCEQVSAGPSWAGMSGAICACDAPSYFGVLPSYGTFDC